MKNLFILFSILYVIVIPSSAMASHIELKPCVQVSHCVREEFNVESIDSPFEKVKAIVEDSPRTKIVELDGDYLHAEVTSRIMKYVDDLEISSLSEKNNFLLYTWRETCSFDKVGLTKYLNMNETIFCWSYESSELYPIPHL